MKKFLYHLCYVFLFLPLWAKAGEDVRKGVASGWHVLESKAVEGLKKNEAVFDFHFRKPSGTHIHDKIRLSYNGKEKTVSPDSTGHYQLKVKPGKYVFQFYYTSQYREIETDTVSIEPAHETKAEVNFAIEKIKTPMRKPVIYLYPQQVTDVQVQLNTYSSLSFTYPTYSNDTLNPGWKVKAYPDGTLEQDGKKFNYLFWEAESFITVHPFIRPGFVVNQNDLTSFLEEKLGYMGLNTREIQDFVTYWVPEMQAHEKLYLRFMWNDEYNTYARLNVSPQPDQMIRVFMLWEPLDAKANVSDIQPQQLPHYERKGFTLVEWGGAQLDYMMKCMGW